ncbi:ATP-binding protein [Candidatus Peregrinibacteria bacterium]|nr:ATP-binding protein [Candidatus Peregrinibacteria bacterium]
MFNRLQKLQGLSKESCFLWGPRQTGKSTLLKRLFPNAPYYDLLLSEEFERLNRHPSLLREELAYSSYRGSVIIDEVQKIPQLLDEIQWLIVNENRSFILCGSSARKLKRGGGNLLGGRALRYQLYPFVSKEIPNFDLIKALNNGLLPRHYLASDPHRLLQAYIGDYLKEEIAAEALTRNISAFTRFLEVASFSNGEVVNYENIARECGVSAPTVKGYFQILIDTLIGYLIPSYQKRPKRRVVQAPKFYFFDLGIANYLLKRGPVAYFSESFGRAFEHFVLQELVAHSHYSEKQYTISYWRTTSRFEVDFILGDDVALEIKSTEQVQSHHLVGLRAFCQEYKPKKTIIVSMDKKPRIIGQIHIMPWEMFLEQLWGGKII